jgi:hypothetical protein
MFHLAAETSMFHLAAETGILLAAFCAALALGVYNGVFCGSKYFYGYFGVLYICGAICIRFN